MKTPRVKIPNLGLTAKLTLWAVLGGIVGFGLIASLAWQISEQRARSRIESQISDALTAFQSYYDRENADLDAVGHWLAGQKDLIDTTRSRDSRKLTSYLEPLTKASIIDTLAVTDNGGTVISRVKVDQAPSQGDNIFIQPGAGEVLAGHISPGVEEDVYGSLQGRLFLPLYDSDKSQIGALLLGYDFDKGFLRYSPKPSGGELFIVYKDRIQVSSLSDRQGKPWIGQLAPADVMVAEREHRASDYLTLETENGAYLVKFNPLWSPAGDVIGMYGMGIPLSSISALQTSLFGPLVFVLLAGLAATFGIGLVTTRSIVSPIQKLTAAAKSMAQGDLSSHIDWTRNDELGDLARQLDVMRQQLRQALSSAHFEKDRIAGVIRSMDTAVVCTDRNDCITDANPAAEVLLRQKLESLVGQSWYGLFGLPNDDEESPSRGSELDLRGMVSKGHMVLKGHFPSRTLPQVVLDVTSTRLEVDGESAGYVHVVRDVSAQENFIKTKDEFILNVAHELRSPLASLRASIDLLIEDYARMDKREMRQMLRTLERATTKFQRLVENLIDIGNLWAGRFRVHLAPTKFADLMKDALVQVEPLLHARGQHLEVEMDKAPDCYVMADRTRIAQVIINLLMNASKYSEDDAAITLSTCEDEGFLSIGVTDHGRGIPPEELESIFTRFFRGKRAEEEEPGIGLGLALAKGIVQAHGGQMRVESQLGTGTTFWFSLPKARPSA